MNLIKWFKSLRRKKEIDNRQTVAGLLIEIKNGLRSERLAFKLRKFGEAKRINGELVKLIESVKMKGGKTIQ